ncbi:MJ0042-type zinc finger domain-containing protein [Bradyrhizobium tropiciagri]|uniref:MJ0042-type zinc finger domain-containing protein n=1 Tax=Bradyrhizobium tropiciagri TaxID=312253 RepID=UPI0032E0332E
MTCPHCQAGYRRIELTSKGGVAGEFRCLVCHHTIELMDGSTDVAFRLTVQPGQAVLRLLGAFSSEVAAGSREENAPKLKAQRVFERSGCRFTSGRS